MNLDRAILVAFLGNYLINTVLAAVVALVPASTSTGILTPQYISFVILSILLVGILTWWYGARDLKGGAIFGVTGFLVAIATAFVTGVAGVLANTGSFSAIAEVLPRFFSPFLWNPAVPVWSQTTLWLLFYWVVPAVLVGWFMQPKAAPMQSSTM